MTNEVVTTDRQVFLRTFEGRSLPFMIPTPCDWKELLKKINQLHTTDDVRFVVGIKSFAFDEDKTRLNGIINTLQDGQTITVLGRLRGGSLKVYNNIKGALSMKIEEFKERGIDGDCLDCLEETKVLMFHCTTLCLNDFKKYLNKGLDNNLWECPFCHDVLRLSTLLDDPMLIILEDELKSLGELLKRFNLCIHCDQLMMNETGYSKQQCLVCKKWICSFCCDDWSSKMVNQLYMCSELCKLPAFLNFEMVDWINQKKIPDRRLCPKCLKQGGFDAKCKFHKCVCGFEFCFFCLESKDDCRSKNKVDYYDPCCDAKKQILSELYNISIKDS